MRPRRTCKFVLCCFLREQVRNLRVQEFLRELVIGVEVPSDLAGSIIVEILHSGEGRDVEQVCSNLETNLPCLRLLISLSYLFLYILHAFVVFILTCLIYLCFIDIQAWVVLISYMLSY